MSKCECKCEEEAKTGRGFIQGHHRKGKTKENDESVRRAAEKMTGKIPTLAMIEGRKKQAEKIRGRTKENNASVKSQSEKMTGRTKENHEGVRKHSEKMTGRTKENNEAVRRIAEKLTGRTKETHEYLRIGSEKRRGRTKENDEPTRIRAEKMKGRTKETHEGNRRQSEKMTGRTKENHEGVRRGAEKKRGRTKENHPGVRRQSEKISKFMSGPDNPMNNPKHRKKLGDSKRGKPMSAEAIQKNSASHIGVKIGPHTKETKRKISETLIERWKDSDFAQKMVKSWNPKPNKPEKLIYNLLQKILPNEYALNVTGHIVIDGKVPDFVNINGQKKLIELNGCFFHYCPICFPDSRVDGLIETEKRIKLFKKYGWSTLVIWEHELEDMKAVTNKILKFHNLPSILCTKQSTIK